MLHACLTQTQIHNWNLEDGCLGPGTIAASHRAAMVAVFDLAREGLHKIRFGQPGFPMVALGVLEVQSQVDILSYIQTLPAK